ncbi:hypothetical protein Z043-109452 [Arapaima gigas]
MAASQIHTVSREPVKSWNQPQPAASSVAPPPRRMNSYNLESSPSLGNFPLARGGGSAFEMPALRGKGAELFAKRQSRMEKFVVDSSTVQANKVRSSSPTPSLPSSWKYTPNIRAPPPLAYNPIQSPSYPPGAIKQPPSSSLASNAKNKGSTKPALKPLHALDVMKHQPYQLNSSLFTYGSAVEAKSPPSKPAPALAPAPSRQSQPVRYEHFSAAQPSRPSGTTYPQQPEPNSYAMVNPSSPLQDAPYLQGPVNVYQPAPNAPYNQVPSSPYQQPQNLYYQAATSPPYQHDPGSPHQQPPVQSYQAGPPSPYETAPSLSYQPASHGYMVPSFQVPPKPASVSGAGPLVAPRPKFSAKKSAAQGLGLSCSLPLPRTFLPSSSSSEYSFPVSAKASHAVKSQKAPTPWEAASRHPLGLVDEAFSFQTSRQVIAASIASAARRKSLPEPPAEWTARVSYAPPERDHFASPTRSVVSAPAAPLLHSSPQRSPSAAHGGPINQPNYISTYCTTWRR